MRRVSDPKKSVRSTPPFGPTELRVLLALMQALAIGLTWHLWQVRTAAGDAPNLPIIESAWIRHIQIGFGWPLMLSLVLAVAWPIVGIPAHAGLLVLAIWLDQMRIQPEFVSVAILLVGTLPGEGPRRLARCHLISLWLWAGVHKLLSAAYFEDSGPRMWTDTIAGLPLDAAVALAWATALFELGLGITALVARMRRLVPWLAALLHLGILLSLLVQRWNPAVWPWNLAVIAAAIGLFGREPEAATRAQEIRDTKPWLARSWNVAAVVALLHPGLYYFGLADGYVSWCVYSSNTPSAAHYAAGFEPRIDEAILGGESLPPAELDDALAHASGVDLQFKHYAALNVPFSPAPRLFRQYFRHVGQPGELLVIEDPRPMAAWSQRERLVLVMTPERKVIAWPASNSR